MNKPCAVPQRQTIALRKYPGRLGAVVAIQRMTR
jgi:hypothetical protein